jgi:hypothetical protein
LLVINQWNQIRGLEELHVMSVTVVHMMGTLHVIKDFQSSASLMHILSREFSTIIQFIRLQVHLIQMQASTIRGLEAILEQLIQLLDLL